MDTSSKSEAPKATQPGKIYTHPRAYYTSLVLFIDICLHYRHIKDYIWKIV